MNDAIDITAAQRKTLLSLLKTYLPGAEVWVYGSRANWTSKPHSDLDMVVFTSTEQSRMVADLKEAFEESSLPFRVDLFVWDEIPDSFKTNITKQHVVLQASAEKTQPPLRAGWTRVTLGEIAQLKNGKGLKNSLYCDDGTYPVWGANGAIARTNELLNDDSVVVIGRVGAYCGSVHAAFGPNWVTDNAIIATPQVDNDFRFLYYLLKSLNLERSATGSAQPLVTQSGLKILRCLRPPPTEQKAIAHILGTLDDKIELNRRMNETLEGIARAIFKSWFVDFDPVRAKAEGRDTGLPKEIEDLFPDGFEESELGEIPKGWKVGKLTDIATVLMGTSPKGATYNDEGIGVPLVNGPAQYGPFFPVKSNWTTAPTKLCERGDLVLCVRGSTTGRRVVADDTYCMGRGVCAIRAYNCWQPFVEMAVDQSLALLLSHTTGSVFPNLSGPSIKQLPMVLSGGDILDAFSAVVTPLRERVWRNVETAEGLTAIRDVLLPHLLSGRLSLSELEKNGAET